MQIHAVHTTVDTKGIVSNWGKQVDPNSLNIILERMSGYNDLDFTDKQPAVRNFISDHFPVYC